MIEEISVWWRCDDCGYLKKEVYGRETTSMPTIQCLPAGWNRKGDGVSCNACTPEEDAIV